ncbi:MAG TPA: PDZ domain-containing protein [Pyrinomonadaceae bacterium]|nr:PDZ domain-containing protein [Pyrinomonadaceae bacterium]
MILNKVSLIALLVALGVASALGQTIAPAQQPKPAPPTGPRPPAPPQNRGATPQVVTVLHRINGLKMFRLLLHSEQGIEAIANLDNTFTLMDDVHTNVIAGLALEDGQTIAARLPEAEVEFTVPAPPPRAPQPSTPDPFFEYRGSMFQSPDLTVIDSEGKKMAAQFVGVDGATGLSILKISGKLTTPAPPMKDDNSVDVGAGVRLLGPEPAPPRRFGVTSLYVRMGESPGTVTYVTQASSGRVARIKARASRLLSAANVGGIAVNATGETLGIIDSVEGTEANILPASSIRGAVKRVLARQASVPKPWLGVKGNPVGLFQIDQMLQFGWESAKANNLMQDHRGILVTWIAPNSPAALAALKAGDVILKVNNEAIQNAEVFSWMLEEAGPSSNVEFTVARPDTKSEELVNVVLSASPNRSMAIAASAATPGPKNRWLISRGIEAVALRRLVAERFGSSTGLLVVYVEPGSTAFEAGLLPGDVIESINGTPALGPISTVVSGESATPAKFGVVRKKQKMVISVARPAKKN